ncbi:MAG: hypothetical protein RLZZ299_2192 [Pseudomonadota bacterium]
MTWYAAGVEASQVRRGMVILSVGILVGVYVAGRDLARVARVGDDVARAVAGRLGIPL